MRGQILPPGVDPTSESVFYGWMKIPPGAPAGEVLIGVDSGNGCVDVAVTSPAAVRLPTVEVAPLLPTPPRRRRANVSASRSPVSGSRSTS